jgi:hypothetical protein
MLAGMDPTNVDVLDQLFVGDNQRFLSFQRGQALVIVSNEQAGQWTSVQVPTQWNSGTVVCDALIPAQTGTGNVSNVPHAAVNASTADTSDGGSCDTPPPVAQRKNCGHMGSTQQTCTDAGCCWLPVNPNPGNAPWCYDPSNGPTPPSPPSPPSPSPPPAPPSPGGRCATVGDGGRLTLTITHGPRVMLPAKTTNHPAA